MTVPPEKIIRRPVITEKSSTIQFEENKYTFEVAPKASKVEIRRAVEQLFDVKVTGVWTMNVRGKKRRVRMQRQPGRKPRWKKAVVALAEGDMIDVYEGV